MLLGSKLYLPLNCVLVGGGGGGYGYCEEKRLNTFERKNVTALSYYINYNTWVPYAQATLFIISFTYKENHSTELRQTFYPPVFGEDWTHFVSCSCHQNGLHRYIVHLQ